MRAVHDTTVQSRDMGGRSGQWCSSRPLARWPRWARRSNALPPDSPFAHRPVELFEPEHTPLAGGQRKDHIGHRDIADLRDGNAGLLTSEATAVLPVDSPPQLLWPQPHGTPPALRCGSGEPPTVDTKITGRACHTKEYGSATRGSVKSPPSARAAAAPLHAGSLRSVRRSTRYGPTADAIIRMLMRAQRMAASGVACAADLISSPSACRHSHQKPGKSSRLTATCVRTDER